MKSILIFSGYNFRAIVAFCRYAKAQGVPVAIVASGPSDPIYRTAYASHVVAERRSRALEVGEVSRIVRDARREHGIEHFDVLPSSEFLNRFFLEWRERFCGEGVAVPLCDRDLYERISDKASFCEMCAAAGLDVPRELPADAPLKYPVVIKPRTYLDAHGVVQTKPLLVFDDAQHADALGRIAGQDVFLQEYVEGDSYYLLYHIAPDGRHVSFSQRNLVQQADGASIVAAVPATLHLHAVGAAYRDLLVAAGFHGLVMIEVRCSGDRAVMIEANPRLWGPSQLFVDCGVPLFGAFLAQLGYPVAVHRMGTPAGVETGAAATLDDRRYFWSGGIVGDQAAGRELAYHGYDPASLARELHLWLRSDVYLRADTIDYAHHELHDE